MKDRFDNSMILYRPVGLQELELIYNNGMEAFPTRLAQQPIFYPVLQLEYARQTALDWNAKNGQFAGYVTQFKVDDEYVSGFEEHTVGGSGYQEFWIPAEELDEFNRHIIGHIKVVEAYFGESFQGFIPDEFGLKGKNAVDQFSQLANSYIYKRMDFYLEIKRNHTAVFLNYPFWQKYNFKNQGLKEKIIQAIREAWLTSFPKTPLVDPVREDAAPAAGVTSQSLVSPAEEDDRSVKPINLPSLVKPDHEDTPPLKHIDSQLPVNPTHEDPSSAEQTNSHFSQGLALGLDGKYNEAVDELFKAVEGNPKNVVARTSLGVAFHRSGEDGRALSCYDAALKMDPTYAEAHYFRANILYSQGNVREAIAGYTTAVGLKPDLIEAHQKPLPQDRLTDYTQSPAEMHWIAKPANRILELNKSLEANPRQANLFKHRAAEYSRLQNYEQVVADYSSSLTIQPVDANALYFRGVAYEQLGQLDRAMEDYQQAIDIDPQLSGVYINRGITLGKMGNFRQSIVSLTEGIRLSPKNPDGYFNRGMTYIQQGDFEKAIADFSNVIRLSPRDEAAYYWRGISYEEAGHQHEAIDDYKQFLALSQDANAREEIEERLSQWNVVTQENVSNRGLIPDDRQEKNQARSEKPDQSLDLYDLILALGERALNSTWFGSGLDCYGEKVDELYDSIDHEQPIDGQDLLRITSGISQTIEGDFQAFDPGTSSPWIFIRAWKGSGFYVETNDPKSKKRLKGHFQEVEEVEGVEPPYEGLFIHI